jgi:hypothetical protein
VSPRFLPNLPGISETHPPTTIGKVCDNIAVGNTSLNAHLQSFIITVSVWMLKWLPVSGAVGEIADI